MALLKFDSFDHLATAHITRKHTSSVLTVGGTVITIDPTGGRHGTGGAKYSYSGANGTLYIRGPVAASGATAIIGCGFKFDALAGGGETRNGIISVYDTAGIQCCVCVTDTGALRVRRGGATGTSLGVSAAVLSIGAWYYIEFKVLLATGATGTYEVRVNTTNVLSGTSTITANAGVTTWDGYGLIANTGDLPLASPWYLDDLYILDGVTGPAGGPPNNDFLGPVRALKRVPNGAGASTDFTPSAGANWQNVDDATSDDDTTYNACSTPGDHDTYAYEPLGVTGTIFGVQTNVVCRSDGAGAETVRPKIRIDGTDYNGTTVGTSTSYTNSSQVYQVSPDSGVTWTEAEFDATEFGAELVT